MEEITPAAQTTEDTHAGCSAELEAARKTADYWMQTYYSHLRAWNRQRDSVKNQLIEMHKSGYAEVDSLREIARILDIDEVQNKEYEYTITGVITLEVSLFGDDELDISGIEGDFDVTNSSASDITFTVESLDPNAPLVLVEYSDTECPYCKQFHSTMNSIVSGKQIGRASCRERVCHYV